MDIASKVRDFQSLPLEKRREACLTLLSDARSRGGLFAELYSLVESGKATEKQYSDIFESAMVVLAESKGEKLQESVDRLERVRDVLREVRKREEGEKRNELETADSLLSAMT